MNPYGIAVLVVVLSCGFSHPQPASGAVTRNDVREAIARWWDSIDTMNATYERLAADETGAGEIVAQENHVAIGAGGKYAVETVYVLKDGRRQVVVDERTDGRRTFQVSRLPGETDVPNYLHVKNSESGVDCYAGPMNDLF